MANKVLENSGERPRGPLELDDLAGEFVDAPRDALVAREDLGLYLVYVVLEAGNHRSAVVHDPVHDGVQDGLRPQQQEPAVAFQPMALLPELGCPTVADHDHEVLSHEDVDLPKLHGLGLVHVTGGPEHDEERPPS